MVFGLQPAQLDEAGDILRAIGGKWRELVAGSEGFLVGHRREGLEGEVVVGDGIKLRIRVPITYFQRPNQQRNIRSPFRVRSHKLDKESRNPN